MNRLKIKGKIQFEIEKAMEEILELKSITAPISPENSVGRISRMDAINNKSVTEAALSTKQVKLRKLKEALNNVDNPGFGICTSCHKPIPVGRLLLMPEADKCVSCAS
jgi:RNA polymerase-binding transcription factor